MGSLLGRNRAPAVDPFYNPVPPPRSLPPSAVGPGPIPGPGLGPGAGIPPYDPYEEYGYEYVPTEPIGNYGAPIKRRVNPYGGRYAQGLNQIPGMSPWNYGNFYLGNTTMQMMPMMLNKVHEYGQMQAMSMLGNAGLLGPSPMMPSMPMMPNMPMMPSMPCCPLPSFSMPMAPCCLPPSFNMSMASPMMAAATPLPVAFNPLVQGMYPMASMSPASWMTPSSFMSALSSGPMPYRPPAFDFPNNVGMVMTVPYGTPNPFFSASSFGGFNSSYNFGGGPSWSCCCYPIPPPAAPAPPPITYYPRPVPVPQPYPVPYSAPVAVPNVQQVPVPRQVSVVAPPIVAGGNQSFSMPMGAPLCPSHGVLSNGGFNPPAVMASNYNTTTQIPASIPPAKPALPVYNAVDQSQLLIGQQITSNTGTNNNQYSGVTHSSAKNPIPFSQNHESLSDRLRRHLPSIISQRFSRSNYNLPQSLPYREPNLPPILHGTLISDSGWLPKTSKPQTLPSILSSKKRKRLLYNTNDFGKTTLNGSSNRLPFSPNLRRRRSSSSTSEYDCAICQQQREKRRLRDHYGSSTVSSLLSSPKESRKHRFSSNESNFSSKSRTPNSFKQTSYQSHRRHPTKIKIKSKSPSPKRSASPVLIRQSPIQDQRPTGTIHEEAEEDEEEEDDVEEEKEETPVPVPVPSPIPPPLIVKKPLDDDDDTSSEQSNHYQSKISLKSIDE